MAVTPSATKRPKWCWLRKEIEKFAKTFAVQEKSLVG